MPTVRIPIAIDASVTSAVPSKNYGGYKDLAVESASPSRQGYLWCALPAIVGKRIVSATFVGFERYTYGGGSRQLTVWLLEEAFKQGTINYNNRPGALSGAPTAATTQGDATAPNRLWTWDVTDLIQYVADGAPWYGFWLTSTNSTKWFMWSSEGPEEFRPYLEIEYAGPPEKPTDLSPAGGRAISVARPLHRFGFVDTSDDSLAGFQVQWAASEDGFDTPTKDTGHLDDETLPQWTPDVDITADATTWWRVKTWDSTGLDSDWSDPVSFVRTAKSTVAITSPADEGTVSEPTPPITWTTTGTQTAFQVFILDPATGAILSDSGKRPGTETSYSVPADVLVAENTTYKVVVRSWDDVARESIPGDPAYVEVSASFTLVLSDTVDPVSGLTASPMDGVGYLLAWTRASTPDAYALRVGGVFTGDTIDPASVLVSGTSYRLAWWGAPPRRNSAVEVVPIVNGVAAAGNPVVSVRPEPKGFWLSGTDGEDAIMLSNTGEGDWDDTTISAVHQGKGAPFPVVRTQVLGAKSVYVEGHMTPRNVPAGMTMDEWVEAANRLRDPAGQRLRLVKTNINVVGCVDHMRIDPVDEHGRVRVRFDFYEQPVR